MSKKVNLEELKEIIRQDALEIINEQKITSKGDPTELDMNTLDREDNSEGKAKVKVSKTGKMETKSGVAKTEEVYNEDGSVKDMNQQDDDQGHDEEIATAVEVKAAAKTKKGGHIEGQREGDFTSKKENPKVSVDNDPMSEDKVGIEPEMNKEDKEQDEGTKTFVEPGAEMSKGHSTGQKKAVPSESAKNEKDAYEEKLRASIETVQLPEGFKNKGEMLSFIKSKARKLLSTVK